MHCFERRVAELVAAAGGGASHEQTGERWIGTGCGGVADERAPVALFRAARRLASAALWRWPRWRFPVSVVEGGEPAGHGLGRWEAERRRPQIGGAAWHGHAGGDHAFWHANIAIKTILSAPCSKSSVVNHCAPN